MMLPAGLAGILKGGSKWGKRNRHVGSGTGFLTTYIAQLQQRCRN